MKHLQPLEQRLRMREQLGRLVLVVVSYYPVSSYPTPSSNKSELSDRVQLSRNMSINVSY